MPSFRKILLLTILAVVAIALVFAIRPSPVQVTLATAEHAPFVEYIEEEGRTVLRDLYVVSTPISGYLQRVEREPGDRVEAGDILFSLQPPPAPALDPRTRQQAVETVRAVEARLQAASREWEARQAELRRAKREFERAEKLRRDEAISEADLDAARDAWDRAAALEKASAANQNVVSFELQNARAVLEIADGSLSAENRLLEVRSPISGAILRRHRESAGPVQPGQPIFDLGTISALEIQVDLLSLDAVRVQEKMRVELIRWGGETDLAGHVRRVGPAGFTRVSALGVDEQRVPVRVSFDSPPEDWQTLGEGYRVEARFILWEGEDVLQIPSSALFRRDNDWALYVAESGRAQLRSVVPGRRSGLRTQIISGINAGESVIVHPGDEISTNTRIQSSSSAAD